MSVVVKVSEQTKAGLPSIKTVVFLGFCMAMSLIIHEYAHAAACLYYGSTPEINIGVLDDGVKCVPVLQETGDLLAYWASGGAVAGAVFAAPLMSHRSRKRDWFSPLVAVIAAQALNALIETYAHYWYIAQANLSMAMITAFTIAVWLAVHGMLSGRFRGTGNEPVA